MDYYRLGCVFDYIYKSPQVASQYYKAAASKINIDMPTQNDRFILNKLADRVDLDFFLEVDEEPIRDFFSHDDVPVPEKKKSKIEDQIVWTADNNNVHDTNINSEIVEKIDRIRNRTREPLTITEVELAIAELKMPDFEAGNKGAAMETIKHIKSYNQCLNKAEMHEVDLLGYIVSDIRTNYAPARQQVLMENLVNNLKDSSSDGNVVCINGRMSRMLNSYTDGEEETFKTLEAWKNELFESASRAKKNYLDSLDPPSLEIYNHDIQGERLTQITKDISSVMKVAISDPNAPPKVIATMHDEIKYCV